MSDYTIVCIGTPDVPHDQVKIGFLHDGVVRPKSNHTEIGEAGEAHMRCPMRRMGCRQSAAISADTALEIGRLLDGHPELTLPLIVPERFVDPDRTDWPAVTLLVLSAVLGRMPKVRKLNSSVGT
jgi:hypothetical protein